MKKLVLCLAVAAVFLLPALAWADDMENNSKESPKEFSLQQKTNRVNHEIEQQQADIKFRDQLKSILPAQRKQAVKDHEKARFDSNQAFNEKQHEESLAYLQARLAQNDKLTDAQKQEMIGQFESRYQENVAFNEQQHEENLAFFEKIANDPKMSPEDKKLAIKEHFAQQKLNDVKHEIKQRKTARQERKKIASEVKNSSQPASSQPDPDHDGQ